MNRASHISSLDVGEPAAHHQHGLRQTAFFALALVLSLVCGLMFVAVTVLTVGLWLAGHNTSTTPVADLGFFALGGVMITAGLIAQLRHPERHLAGLQQAVIGLAALGVAGLVGERVEPFTGALILLVATGLLVALHPARREFFKPRSIRSSGEGPSLSLSLPLALLSGVGAVPAGIYAVTMLVQARGAGPSCFLGQCAYGDRFAEVAALAMAVVASGFLAALRPAGWRITALCAGLAAAILGAASVVWPGLDGSAGQLGGALMLAWGVLFLFAAAGEWEARNSIRNAQPE